MADSYDMSEDKLGGFKAAFTLFDRDKDGQINKSDLAAMMKALGQEASEADIQDMIREVDMSGKGSIEFNEFLFMMARRSKEPDGQDDYKTAFAIFDKTQPGRVTAADVKRVLANLGEEITDKEAEQIIKDADTSKSGTLSYDDFVKMSS